MAEALVLFSENDIKGVILPEKVVDKNITEALKHWIACRGLMTTTAESRLMLVRR